MIYDLIKNRTGATLVEVVVAVTLFSFIMLAATGIFKMTIDAQRSALAAKNIQESLRYTLETMSKEIRGAQKNPGPGNSCGVGANEIYNVQGGNPRLRFKNADDECVDYQFDNGNKAIKVTRGGVGPLAITSNDIEIDNLDFIVESFDPNGQQARITIRIAAKAINVPTMHENNFVIQTTVSSRYYE